MPAESLTFMNPPAHSMPACERSFAPFRLRRHAEYQSAYKAARKQSSASMSYFYRVRPDVPSAPSASSAPRIGLTAGRVLGKAVDRNRIKRRMREAVRLHLDLLPAGVDVILHPRRFVGEMEFAALEREIAAVFTKIAAAVNKANRTNA